MAVDPLDANVLKTLLARALGVRHEPPSRHVMEFSKSGISGATCLRKQKRFDFCLVSRTKLQVKTWSTMVPVVGT